MSESSQFQQLTAGQFGDEHRRGALILDTRPAEAFVSFHMAGSTQIGLMGSFASWAATLIEPSQRILLVADDENCAQEAHSRLARVGLNNVVGYACADEKQWRQLGVDLTHLSVHRCKDICRVRG